MTESSSLVSVTWNPGSSRREGDQARLRVCTPPWEVLTMRRSSLVLALMCVTAQRAAAQHHDSAFAAMQERGKAAMGVDQYASTHRFDALKDGGRIELIRNDGDSTDVARIRAHMREIARAFANGDFSTPAA